MSGDGAFVTVNGFKLFYRVFGDSGDTLLCLHGGPGAIHDYLLPLGELSRYGLKVVLYD
jgi:pimeloyl-ACP methyl ester carboxylesterase